MAKLSKTIKDFVARRAKWCCEYCKLLQQYCVFSFPADHITPECEGGTDDLENLANACPNCNGRKHVRTKAIDPVTLEKVPLFHPRQQKWKEHFAWSADKLRIIGLTPNGRATVKALGMNCTEAINLRRIMLPTGEHPPVED